MLRHAGDTVPFYGRALEEMGARPGDFSETEDLGRLPLVGAADLQAHPDAFASTHFEDGDGVTVYSGGSTGEPKAVRHDPEALFANAAHGERERSIVARAVGRTAGYREAVVASHFSAALSVQRFVRERTWIPRRFDVRREYLSLLDEVEMNASRVAALRPHVLQSYGSYVGPLLRRLDERGEVPETLRLVTYSSDVLPEADRRFVVEALGVPVLSTYQAVEAFKIGFECGEGEGLHVNVDLYPVRIVDADGRPVPEGEEGAVLVSNLVNRATVLLNYRIGDHGSWVSGPCPCGRNLPRMTLHGREDDWVEGPGGRRVHPQAIRTLFSDARKIRAYQVVQRSVGRFELLLVASSEVDRARTEERLRRKFTERLGDDVVVEARWVDSLERSPGGKTLAVIRR